MAAAWNDVAWIGAELDRLDRSRQRWGFADIQYSYWAQLQSRIIELDGGPHDRAHHRPLEAPSGALAARPSLV